MDCHLSFIQCCASVALFHEAASVNFRSTCFRDARAISLFAGNAVNEAAEGLVAQLQEVATSCNGEQARYAIDICK